MTRRKRSYFAKSNRGKGAEVFLNNWIVGNASRKKQKKKEELQRQAAREKERARDRKLNEKRREISERDRRKFDKLKDLAVELCRKYGLLHEVAENIAHRAYKECVPPSRMEQEILKRYMNEWRAKNHEVSLARCAAELLDLNHGRVMLERFAFEAARELLGQDVQASDLLTHPAVEKAYEKSEAVLRTLDQQILDFDLNQRSGPAVSVNKEPI